MHLQGNMEHILRSICKWTIDSGALKYMISHRAAFNTYEVIYLHNVHLGDSSVAEVIGMGSVVIGVETKGKINRIRILEVLYVSKLQANLLS